MKPQVLSLFLSTALASLHAQAQNALVLQTDFGLGDGAVSAMQGVAFGDVAEGETLVYLNSLLNASVAINLGNFAEKYGVSSGAVWDIAMRECR